MPPIYELLVGERHPEICGARGCVTPDPWALAQKGALRWELKSNYLQEFLSSLILKEVSQRCSRDLRFAGYARKDPRPDRRVLLEGSHRVVMR